MGPIRRKRRVDRDAVGESATELMWIITKSDTAALVGTKHSGRPVGKRCGPGAVKKARQRQSELEKHLAERREVSLGATPLNGDGSLEKSSRVSFGSVVSAPANTGGQSGTADYSGAAKIARRRRAQRGT